MSSRQVAVNFMKHDDVIMYIHCLPAVLTWQQGFYLLNKPVHYKADHNSQNNTCSNLPLINNLYVPKYLNKCFILYPIFTHCSLLKLFNYLYGLSPVDIKESPLWWHHSPLISYSSNKLFFYKSTINNLQIILFLFQFITEEHFIKVKKFEVREFIML